MIFTMAMQPAYGSAFSRAGRSTRRGSAPRGRQRAASPGDELLGWMALSRVHAGTVVHYREEYLDSEARMPAIWSRS
ncbi:MAG: hypothetical protein M3460_03225 [Actinomycetota bacterium]|nr:hypothetical protein [Actinomycetota bacterium]